LSTQKNAIFFVQKQDFLHSCQFVLKFANSCATIVRMKNKSDKKLIFNMLLPLCKNKEGTFDTAKTADCKRMVKNFGVVMMALGTILLLVGFVGLVVKNTPLSLDVAWYWVAVGFGTLFTCVGIGSINTATNLSTYVKKQLEEPTEATEKAFE